MASFEAHISFVLSFNETPLSNDGKYQESAVKACLIKSHIPAEKREAQIPNHLVASNMLNPVKYERIN